ncbi:hypothetical protein HanIR_Chr05g0214281 [Helianthus annuus]|nr:hypothetical protein HanIR_Chr05g0214281 [Helianthus annuus]
MNAIKTRYHFFLSYQFEPSVSFFLVSGRSCSTGAGICRQTSLFDRYVVA